MVPQLTKNTKALAFNSAFIMLEFLIGIIILSVITVVGSKMLFNVQKHRFFQEQTSQAKFEMQNALDSIKTYLVNASKDSITYENNYLSWENTYRAKEPLTQHKIWIHNNRLFLDDFLMFFPANNFEVKSSNIEDKNGDKNLELKLCSLILKKLVCAQKLVRLLG